MEYLKSRNLSTNIQFYNDEIIGKTFKRPAFNQLKDVVVASDEVVIYQLDRLGRKKEGSKEALEWFKKRGVIVRVLDIPTTLQDFTGMDLGLAKTIMDLINNLMIEMAVAKAKGKQIGNNKKTKYNLPDNFEYYYRLIKDKTLKKKEVASMLRVGESTLWRYCKLFEGSDVYSKNAEGMRNKRIKYDDYNQIVENRNEESTN